MSSDDPQPMAFGPFRLDRRGRRLTRAGVEVPLGGRAFDVLCVLAAARGEAVPKNALLDQVWPGLTVEENNLQVQVSALRKALGDSVIATIPGRGYRLTMAPPNESPPLLDAIAGKPSIAVLAFSNMSGDIEQEYFGDGVADDIITELSRDRALVVIARNSSFAYKEHAVDVRRVARELGVRYVLQGGVRRSADRLRITARLIDAETGIHLWANRYDRPTQDLFALQDEITTAVTNSIRPAVAQAEQRRALRRPPSRLSAWESYQRGLWHALKYDVDNIAPAREFLNRAIELDQTLGSAHVALAWLYVIESGYFGLRPFEEAALLEAEQARIAVNIDPSDPDAHGILAFALFNRGEMKAALDHAEQALSISPSCARGYQTKGMILMFSGQPAKGRESVSVALRYDPRTLDVGLPPQIAISYYFEQDYEKAVDSLHRTLADNPPNPLGYRWLAAALGQLGRTNEAREALSVAIAKWPDSFDRYTQKRPPWFRPEDFEHMLDGLRKAGWQG